ncbi:LysM peptidoglycan-binding domain-containing protein [Alteribacter aurantiacus]|uniref:LysM peptidoglycan-binding domain-containing protein n=1 Tax=Alteribacter aurantiacus TaxID=254410 RepID=UPI00041589B8|nr:LysM domain-containing protein [Alteribacter aurantiacus]
MKQALLFGLILILSVSVYYDLTEGTLPDTSLSQGQVARDESVDVQVQTQPATLEYQEVIVQSGHTVYTIVKALHQDALLESNFEKIVTDFERLNPNVSAHEIRVGQTYRFPIYREVLEQ